MSTTGPNSPGKVSTLGSPRSQKTYFKMSAKVPEAQQVESQREFERQWKLRQQKKAMESHQKNIEKRRKEFAAPPLLHQLVTLEGASTTDFKTLISKGESVHGVDKDNRSPLHIAAMNENAMAISILLQCGANVNSKDKFGDTPLGLCVSADTTTHKIKVVSKLLGWGADVGISNVEGNTPLDQAQKRLNYAPPNARVVETKVYEMLRSHRR